MHRRIRAIRPNCAGWPLELGPGPAGPLLRLPARRRDALRRLRRAGRLLAGRALRAGHARGDGPGAGPSWSTGQRRQSRTGGRRLRGLPGAAAATPNGWRAAWTACSTRRGCAAKWAAGAVSRVERDFGVGLMVERTESVYPGRPGARRRLTWRRPPWPLKAISHESGADGPICWRRAVPRYRFAAHFRCRAAALDRSTQVRGRLVPGLPAGPLPDPSVPFLPAGRAGPRGEEATRPHVFRHQRTHPAG